MQARPLGRTGLRVSEIGFGAWQLGNAVDWSAMADEEAVALVREAVKAGCTFFDTAPNYAQGRSEVLLGQALEGLRDRVVLSSKFGHHADGSQGFDPARLRPSVEASLAKLRTDHLDLLLLHNPPAEVCAAESPLWSELEVLKTEGMIRAYGASVDWSADMRRVMANSGSEVLEVLYNVFHQEPACAFEEAQARGVGLIIKVPLDSGWLSGRYDAASRFQGIRARWSPEVIARRAALVEQVRQCVPGEELPTAALRFILDSEAVSTVIPGARALSQLKASLAASEGRLKAEQVDLLRKLWKEQLEADPLPW